MPGQILLPVAIALALGSTIVGLIGARRSDRPLDTWLLIGSVGTLWAAVAYLVGALMAEDTSFAYVAEQTRTDMSAAIRLSALWSGAEGSLLLFATLCATAALIGHHRGPRWQRVGTGIVVSGLGLASVAGANPFRRLDLPPLSGGGMAPILEHFAMVIHPPLLYLGLALALVPALVRDRATAHRWALVALAVLTSALGFGSAWAYVELGWGGWWAWDPIENIGLIVWLLLAAGLHWRPLDRREQTGSGMLNVVVLWALCWPAVLGGGALTRTSLRTSVHAFADAAGLAVWLWPLVAVAALGAGLRVNEQRTLAGRGGSAPTPRTLISTDGLPQIALAMAAFVIAAGTYRPFIGGDGTAGWFYSRTLYPLAVIGALAIGILPLWPRRPGLAPSLGSMPVRTMTRWGLPGALGLAAATGLAGWDRWSQLVLAAAVGFGVAMVAASGRRPAARLAAHLGVLLVLFAAIAGTASTESAVRLQVGQPVEVDGHEVELLSTEIVSQNPLRAEAVLLVDGSYRLEPSVAVYPERNLRLPEVSTRTRPWLDSQAILRDVDVEAGTLVTILFRPWNQLVWWGVGLLTAAALLAMAGSKPHHRRPAEQPASTSSRGGGGGGGGG